MEVEEGVFGSHCTMCYYFHGQYGSIYVCYGYVLKRCYYFNLASLIFIEQLMRHLNLSITYTFRASRVQWSNIHG